MTPHLMVHLAEDLRALTQKFADLLETMNADVLEPT
jgi:hypothetical protein